MRDSNTHVANRPHDRVHSLLALVAVLDEGFGVLVKVCGQGVRKIFGRGKRDLQLLVGIGGDLLPEWSAILTRELLGLGASHADRAFGKRDIRRIDDLVQHLVDRLARSAYRPMLGRWRFGIALSVAVVSTTPFP